MTIHLSSLIKKIFKKQPIYFFFEKYYINNYIYIILFNKTLLYLLGLLKNGEFFKPTIFLELSAYDYNTLLESLDLPAYTIIYCIFMYSLSLNFFIFFVGSEDESVITSTFLYNNLYWSEKEITEMHGINFFEKNDSRHLLLDYSFNGNPMLKNYSVSGYVELLYNFIIMILVYIQVLLLESIKIENTFDY